MPVGTVQWTVLIKEWQQLLLITIRSNTDTMEVTYTCIAVFRGMTHCSLVRVMDLQKTYCLHVIPRNNLLEKKN
jgi:hypothetical protein